MSKLIREIGSEYNPDELVQYVEKFCSTTIMVVGDIILDEYIWGDVNRISPEAPVPVVEVREETKLLGGAANVVNNISSLGGKALLCGITGGDETAKEIEERIRNLGCPTNGILCEPDRPTTIKTRVVAYNQQVVRFDRESRREIRPDTARRLLDFVESSCDHVHGILISDYGKGVVSGSLMKGLRSLLRKRNVVLAVDPKTGNFEYYQGVDVITPNHHEAGAFCGFQIVDEKTLIKAGEQMLKELNCRSVLITQGKDGMTLFENGGEIWHIPTVARKVFDVTGAGDTVVSTFCLGLASGMDLKSAAIISNIAAGIVVGELGTSTVRAEDLKRNIRASLKH